MSNGRPGHGRRALWRRPRPAEPIIFYAAAREWRRENPDTIKNPPPRLPKGAIVNNDPRETSVSISKFTKHGLSW